MECPGRPIRKVHRLNASQPGYISEKITDCFAARCVPIYLGSRGYEKRIPADTYINYADFKSLAELERFLVSMSESEHDRYLDAIERFVNFPEFLFFSANRFAGLIGDGLGLTRRGAGSPEPLQPTVPK